MAGYTKKMVAEASQRSVTAIIRSTSAPPKVFVPFLVAGLGDKIVQARQHFAAHLQTYLDQHAQRHKDAITHSAHDGFAQLQAAMRKVIMDSNPAVRENARLAYWAFAAEWPSEAEQLMLQLDEPAQKQLRKAKESVTASANSSRPTASTSKAPVPRKPSSSIAEAIKKAKMEARQRQQEQEQEQARAAELLADEPVTPKDDESRSAVTSVAEQLATSVIGTGALESPGHDKRTDSVREGPSDRERRAEANVPNGTKATVAADEAQQEAPSQVAQAVGAFVAADPIPQPTLSMTGSSEERQSESATENDPSPTESRSKPTPISSQAAQSKQAAPAPSLNGGTPVTASTNGSSDTLYGMLQIAPDSSFWRQRNKSEQGLGGITRSDR